MITTHSGRCFFKPSNFFIMFTQYTLRCSCLLFLVLLVPFQTHGATFKMKSPHATPPKTSTSKSQTAPELAQADFMVHTITISNDRPQIGQTIKVTATIANLSNAVAEKVPVSFIYRGQHKDIIIAQLDVRKRNAATAEFKILKPVGSQFIEVVVNPKKTVKESNYSNNNQKKIFSVASASSSIPERKQQISGQKSRLSKQVDGTGSAGYMKKVDLKSKIQAVTPQHPVFTGPSEEECHEYATSAVALAGIAERNHCGYQGNRWLQDEEEHFNWCMKTSSSARIEEADARQSEVNHCIDCRVYAKEAVEQFEQSEANGCKYTGSRWQADRDQHFGWCMSAGAGQPQEEKEERDKALQICKKDKRFDLPKYMGLSVDFCMYRRTETYNEVKVDPGPYSPAPVSFDYDFGWSGNNEPCGGASVVESFCLSQGYAEVVDYKVAGANSSVDTMPLGNAHKCDATIDYSNCRGFDFITCRNKISDKDNTLLSPTVALSSGDLKKTAAIRQGQKSSVSVKTKAEICNSYAETAIQQSYQADTIGCEVSGDAWNKDLQGHIDWCMSANTSQLETETSARQDKLQKCGSCRSYAEESVRQYHQANSHWCTVGTKHLFHPSVWHGDVETHYNWCMSESSNAPQAELEKRDAVLDECSKFHRIYFDKPTYNGFRVDTRFTKSTGDIKKSADAFCAYKGYAGAVNDWQGYAPQLNSVEEQDKSIYIGNGMHCSHDPEDIMGSGDGECRALNHIICEKIAVSMSDQQGETTTASQVGVSLKKPVAVSITQLCQQYTEEAISQYQQAEALHCGDVSLETWSQSYQYLMDWCSSADASKRQQQANARKAYLEECKDCYAYGQQAVSQYHEFVTNYCAVGGAANPIWNGDIDAHVDWCIDSSAAEHEAENNKRKAKLQECLQTERKRFAKPVVNGMRVDVYLNQRNGNQIESDVPQRAADAFCQRQGYIKALKDWSYYYSPFTEDNLPHTIHMGEGLPECNTGAPSYHKECKAFSHIICERPATP